MSDVSLWERIRGHDQTVNLLRGVIDKARPAHAYLFYGPRGVGKTKTAMAFAAALNCASACGVCPSCRSIQAHTHPDFHFVEPEGQQTIMRRQIVDLLKVVHLKRRPGGYKVIVIDEAQELGPEAANTLLKTLEEPPEGVVFVLVASNIDRVLGTIASRCQRIAFSALDSAVVSDILVADYKMAPDKAELAAGLTRGMVGEAIELAAGGLLDIRPELLKVMTDTTGDVSAPALLAENLIALAKKRTAKVKKAQEAELAEIIAFVEGSTHAAGMKKRVAANQKRELARLEHRFYRQALLLAAALYRDLLLISENVDTRFLANRDMAGSIERAGATPRQVRAALANIEETGRRLAQNVSPLLAFENLFFVLGDVA